METSYAVIPNAVARIHALLKQRRLVPKDPAYTPEKAVAAKTRYYMTPVVDRRGRTFWLKANLQADRWLSRALREEINTQRVLASHTRRHHAHFDSPSYLASGGQGSWRWLIRKFWNGEFAGNMDDVFGFTPAFLRRVSPERMAAILQDIRDITRTASQRLQPPTHGLDWYLFDYRYYLPHFFRPVLRHRLNFGLAVSDIRAITAIFRRHTTFFRRQATTFTHGDMYPTNIMLCGPKKNRVVVFDWELSHFNLPTFDAVMVYLHAWRQPAWQARFKSATMRLLGPDATHQTAWRLAMLSLATRLTAFGFIRLANIQPGRYPRRLTRVQTPIVRRLYRHTSRQLLAALRETGVS